MSGPRIGVNLTWLVPGVVGGSEEATTDLLRGLLALTDDTVDLHLFTLPAFAEAHPDLASVPASVAPVGGGSRVRRVIADNTWLRTAVAGASLDLVHHAGGVVPPLVRGPATLTIHDVQPLERTDGFSPLKRLYLRALLGRSARGARRVSVPTAAVRAAVVERLGADSDRVDVVPWSVRRPRASTVPERDQIRRRLGVGERFLLYPAIAYPHKRHALLVDAWIRCRQNDPDLQLVLTGREGPCTGSIRSQAAAAGVDTDVRMLGRIRRTELDALYASATCLVFPSSYEGFGLPVTEALAAGCPVVAADLDAYDEWRGAIRTVAGDDPSDWADAILDVTGDAVDRSTLVAKGLELVEFSTPERTARLQLATWRHALENPV